MYLTLFLTFFRKRRRTPQSWTDWRTWRGTRAATRSASTRHLTYFDIFLTQSAPGARYYQGQGRPGWKEGKTSCHVNSPALLRTRPHNFHCSKVPGLAGILLPGVLSLYWNRSFVNKWKNNNTRCFHEGPLSWLTVDEISLPLGLLDRLIWSLFRLISASVFKNLHSLLYGLKSFYILAIRNVASDQQYHD